ncbi:hypothetical protein [Allohahella sp. A8]|uniref:hypothetical protein n=1 Tax=Allohahella sp. A8 TaxID=3141461 RepID=UPI000C0958FC|nr:hypothetical protein [Hahellaceae bacterium]|tara:strand:- start:30896 stop:31471 length:576 start_codon:yes stop_codon:yes gene_type:complete
MICKRALFIAAGLALASAAAIADEITEAIDTGLSAYKDGDMSTAASQLDYASTLIRQKKAEQITGVFPEPLSGWTAEDAQSESSGAAMFGGGISANRSYQKGDSYLTIELVMDSPMLQSMMGMFNNPSMIAMQGGKLIKIAGNNAMLEEDGERTKIVFVANNTALFTLTGDGMKADEVKAYANAIKLDKLK